MSIYTSHLYMFYWKWPFVWWAPGHEHYEQTLHSRRPCIKVRIVFIYVSICSIGYFMTHPATALHCAIEGVNIGHFVSWICSLLKLRAALHLEADCMNLQPFLGWRTASTTHYNL